jgi:hypothetical protein
MKMTGTDCTVQYVHFRNSNKEREKMYHISWKVLALRLTGGTIGAL